MPIRVIIAAEANGIAEVSRWLKPTAMNYSLFEGQRKHVKYHCRLL
jgi:hypothetical protein